MPYFANTEFFTNKPIDIQSKIINPSLHLYQQTSEKIQTFYVDSINNLLEFHNKLSIFSKDVYSSPITDIFNNFYDLIKKYSVDLTTFLKIDINQNIDFYYQKFLFTVSEKLDYFKFYFQENINNPKRLIDYTNNFLESITSQLKNYLTRISEELAELSNLLSTQPVETLQAIYRNIMSVTADTYFEIISSLLISV